LTTASWLGQLKELLGLTGVGQVWDQKPSWYFWIESADGVYCLTLEKCLPETSRQQKIARGIFSIKCYPFPESQVFGMFSPEEQRIVTSGAFDDTNTPRFECRESIPETLFGIGTLEYVFDLDNTWSFLLLETLSRMKLIDGSRKGKLRQGDESACDDVREKILRNVPAWNLSYLLFDRLVSIHANYSKTAPSRIAYGKRSGFEIFSHDTNGLICSESNSTETRCLNILFSRPDLQSAQLSDIFLESMNQDPVNMIYDINFVCSDCHTVHVHELHPDEINPLWWEIVSADFKSELCSTCGCH
jgi:hypothetical protein